MARRKRPVNSHVRAQQIVARKRRARVEELELEGVFSQRRIAATLGVSLKTVEKDLTYIHEMWEMHSR